MNKTIIICYLILTIGLFATGYYMTHLITSLYGTRDLSRSYELGCLMASAPLSPDKIAKCANGREHFGAALND